MPRYAPELFIRQNAAAICRDIGILTGPSAIGGISESIHKALSGTLNAISDDLESGKRLPAVHEKIAKEAQNAILAAYQSNVIAQKQVPSYRRGQGRFPGGLGAVLGSKGFIQSNVKGFRVGNRTQLNAQARHWARLNFGAGPKAESGEPAVVTQMVIHGASIGPPIQFTEGPRPGFNIPENPAYKGYFKGPNPSEFHIIKKGKRGKKGGSGINNLGFAPRPASGIAGRRFLDAGFLAVTTYTPVLYETFYKSMTREAAKKHVHDVQWRSQKAAGSGGRFASPTVNVSISDFGY